MGREAASGGNRCLMGMGRDMEIGMGVTGLVTGISVGLHQARNGKGGRCELSKHALRFNHACSEFSPPGCPQCTSASGRFKALKVSACTQDKLYVTDSFRHGQFSD